MRRRWKPCLVSALSVLLISWARATPQEASEALSFVTWREPNDGAYSLSVPQGWKISGGIWRRTPVDVRSAVNVVSQGGAIHLFIGDYDVPPARGSSASPTARWSVNCAPSTSFQSLLSGHRYLPSA